MKDPRRPQQRTGSMVRVGSRGGQGLDDEARIGKTRMMLISGCILMKCVGTAGGWQGDGTSLLSARSSAAMLVLGRLRCVSGKPWGDLEM